MTQKLPASVTVSRIRLSHRRGRNAVVAGFKFAERPCFVNRVTSCDTVLVNLTRTAGRRHRRLDHCDWHLTRNLAVGSHYQVGRACFKFTISIR